MVHTMRYLFLFILFAPQFILAQDYFQQEVNYTIEVRLDDKKHQLHAFERFEYVNNSPDALTKLYIHLWPNAYKNDETALARQQYDQGEDLLQFGPESYKGWIDSIDFKVNDQTVKWYYDEEHIDIAVIELSSPLQPGNSIFVSTPFRVQIPSGKISRLGHIRESYQITQWYPKPAVYDVDGWHQMPYLGQGEFFSEYGSFDVKITLPENYVVGATGDLQTESELAYLDELAEKTQTAIDSGDYYRDIPETKNPGDFPPSSSTFKTIRYTQKNVHDFAWFADKRFSVLKDGVVLPHSGRLVTTWAMFTPSNNAHLWNKASEYLKDATYYYSLWNGDYPYNQVTAVDGTISAGGGMEYPNVTVIGRTGSAHELEVVIVHEVGHNWFYGQLGSNERDHGWMDEGMNTLNEIRYIQTKYPDNTAMSDMVLNGSFHFNDLNHHDLADVSYRAVSWLGEDQPIETHSAEFTPYNYGIIMYQKTGLVFFYLKEYLGEDLFDKAMKAYYKEWEFRHPSPLDMQRSLEKTTGKDLSWLFHELIQTTNHIDYKISKVKRNENGVDVTVKNKGQVDGPIPVTATYEKNSETKWAEPGQKKTTLHFEKEPSTLVIDPEKDIPELNRANNRYNLEKVFSKIEKVKFEFVLGDHEPDRTNHFWTPILGGNEHDKFMLGVGLHNYGVSPSKVQYSLAPMFSFGRRMVSGFADINITTQPKSILKQSRLGVTLKSFKHDSTYRHNQSYYLALLPYWSAKLGNRNKKAVPYSNHLKLQGIYRKDQFGPTHFEHVGAYLEYSFNLKKTDHQFHAKIRNEYFNNVKNADQMARIYAEATYKLRYLRKKKDRHIEIRIFGGNQYLRDFGVNQQLAGRFGGYQYSMSLSGTDGQQDLFLDEFYFGRNLVRGIWSQQRNENMGGFRSTSYYGTTNLWMTTANLWLQFPYIPKFIGAFADVGMFDNGVGVQSAVNTGLGIRFGNTFGLYFPIWMSKELNDSFGNSKYAEKIRFTLRFNLLNQPIRVSDFI